MKKRKLYNTLANKYNLPYKYIKFTCDSRYLYKANVEVDEKFMKEFENMFLWDNVKECFEIDRNTYSSIFYGM